MESAEIACFKRAFTGTKKNYLLISNVKNGG